MSLEKVIFGFFILLAATLNFGFFIGDIDDPVAPQRLRALRRGRREPDRDRAEVRRPHPDRRRAPRDQPGRRPAADRRGRRVGRTRCTRRRRGSTPHVMAIDRLAVRRRAVRQRGLGRAARDRDRLVPAPLAARGHVEPAARLPAAGARRAEDDAARGRCRGPSAPSSAIFLVLRRMRTPLIVLIAIYAISVLGLTLIPGQDADGKPWSMGFFHAFYFMSYTATTIGFGEIPHAFTDAPAPVGHVLHLPHGDRLGVRDRHAARAAAGPRLPSRARRAALRAQGARACASRSCWSPATARPAARSVARSTRSAGAFVVVDIDQARIDELELESFRADVPGLVADARNPEHLRARRARPPPAARA